MAIDRESSTIGPGDPGADRIEIAVSTNQVMIKRFYRNEPVVWTLPLATRMVDGTLVITQVQQFRTTIWKFALDQDKLLMDHGVCQAAVARCARPGYTPPMFTMVCKRVS